MHAFLLGVLWCCQIISGVSAAFGVTQTGGGYRVDTNGGLVFDVRQSDGAITNLNYQGVQYQDANKLSAINSGLGASVVTAQTVNGYVKITVKANSLPVTQYFVAKPNDPTIYMATYITGEVDPGELRWLARLRRDVLPYGVRDPVGDTNGCTAFEGKDTFRCSNGQTRCKMYTSDRFIDDTVHGVTGPGVGVWLIMPGTAYEHSSGGPFMRDINGQEGEQQELYWYMNSGHVRTEPWRFGLQGPYAMKFTQGEKPSSSLDTTFFDDLNILGYLDTSGRGAVQGTAGGISSGFDTVLHWYNSNAQYWVYAAGGKYKSPSMRPGAYTVKLYRNELEVARGTVSVQAGQTTTQNLVSTAANPPVIWRIGQFDGQPFELKNGNKFERMHPSDVRMGSWGGTYTVGSSTSNDFPMAVFSKIGGAAIVKFTLSESQKSNLILRIGTTLSFKGGRPAVKINSWTGSDPGAPTLIDSRGVTRGAYRGYGNEYTWNIPANAVVTGQNTLTITAAGTGDADYLSANFIFDAVELQGSGGTFTSASPTPTTTGNNNPTTAVQTTRVSTTTRLPPTCLQQEWTQCAGLTYTGCTTCASTLKCVFVNEYYSQCQV